MAKTLNVKVQKDYIESLTTVSGTTALMELIWNALDANASMIEIKKIGNEVHTESIEISDNGNGIKYDEAIAAFEKLGGSLKKEKKFSPGERAFHGEEGKGRYNAFGLGNLISFKSFYKEGDLNKFFEIKLDRNHLTQPDVGDLYTRKEDSKNGFTVLIENVDEKKANSAFSVENIKSIEQKLAIYYQQYPTFKIKINGKFLDFSSFILNEETQDIPVNMDIEGVKSSYDFKIRIVEWTRSCEKKLYYCNQNAISFGETNLGVQTSGLNVSAYLMSDYIGTLHRQHQLSLAEMDIILSTAVVESKKIIRKYIRDRIHGRSADFIKELKEKQIYPYEKDPIDEVENATRQVFDIVALNINEYVPHFSDQEDVSKKLTLSLVKEALETNPTSFHKIITEVINLPEEKMDDLKELLETTSLSTVIDTMKEVTDRLRFLYELKVVVMDPIKNKKVLERKHLHKIVEHETWIFGDDYTLGASDVSLKNVLKSHLKELGRNDFESVVDEGDNTNLNEIPDVCLWKQYNNGKNGYHRNLVIELKRPTVNGGRDELGQIMSYAQKVRDDNRFEKDKTEWTFILLVNDIKKEIMLDCEQQNRKFGHIHASDGLNVFVVKWGTLFNEAEARHQYLKEKLNYNISEDQEGLSLLNAKYEKYIPGVLKK